MALNTFKCNYLASLHFKGLTVLLDIHTLSEVDYRFQRDCSPHTVSRL